MMIPFEKALSIVLENAHGLDTELVDLGHALGRVLADDVAADRDMPPFDKSAMDGYACRRADLAEELSIIETIAAGNAPTRKIGARQCAKIMTGAPVPPGADCVIMIEHTEAIGEDRVRFTGRTTSNNICRQGEDLRAGQVVLRRGELIRPQHIAVLAGVGGVHPRVFRRARVGILATGDELVEPEVVPAPWQIRTSNSHQLAAQAAEIGAVPTYYGILPDSEAAIVSALESAAGENDVVLLSGGVSMGDYDLVPAAMEKCGFRILFDAIAMKPGKPTTFAVSPTGCCFGLPGNPVSTFVQFTLLVKPFLYRLMGHTYDPPCLALPLAQTVNQQPSDRVSWLPVRITDQGEATPCEYHGSAHIHALCAAHGLIRIPPGAATIEKGTIVHVRPF